MRKINKKLIIIISILTINVCIFAQSEINDLCSYSYNASSSYDLQEITVNNLYNVNTGSIKSGTSIYKGYHMGQLVMDFNNGYYSTLLKDVAKTIISRKEGSYFYNGSYYNAQDKCRIYDTNYNVSTISGYINITRKNKEGNVTNTAWYDISNSYYWDYSSNQIFKNITTDSITIDYYFIIDDFGNLKPGTNWILFVPNKSNTYDIATLTFKIIDQWKYPLIPEVFNYNYIYTNSGNISVGNSLLSSDIYNLNVDIEKKFDENSDDFFDGQKHDYYSLNFNSYKYQELTEDPFSVCLEISSAHNWKLNLDNTNSPTSNETIDYKLFLKYKDVNNYSLFEIKDNTDKILITNIKSSNSSSIIYFVTQSTSANPTIHTKGRYQDTIYINFITEGWDNNQESLFAEKTIKLAD